MDIHSIQMGVDNCYILKQERALVIDGGMPGEFSKFSKGLKDRGLKPGAIQALVITHCHWDHIGCAKQIKDMTVFSFKRMKRIYYGKAQCPCLRA